jgi:hypothetical protein
VPVLARDARQHRRRDHRGDTMTYQGIAERGALDSGPVVTRQPDGRRPRERRQEAGFWTA